MTRHQAEVSLREMNKVRCCLSQVSHIFSFWIRDRQTHRHTVEIHRIVFAVICQTVTVCTFMSSGWGIFGEGQFKRLG